MEAVKDHVGGNNPALAQKIARDYPGPSGNPLKDCHSVIG